MTYRLVYSAGYLLNVPLQQFSGRPESLDIRLRERATPGDEYSSVDPWDNPPRALPIPQVIPDAISRITRECDGKIFHIYSPEGLASALQRTDELLRWR